MVGQGSGGCGGCGVSWTGFLVNEQERNVRHLAPALKPSVGESALVVARLA